VISWVANAMLRRSRLAARSSPLSAGWVDEGRGQASLVTSRRDVDIFLDNFIIFAGQRDLSLLWPEA
jgi:hypothetical protein